MMGGGPQIMGRVLKMRGFLIVGNPPQKLGPPPQILGISPKNGDPPLGSERIPPELGTPFQNGGGGS